VTTDHNHLDAETVAAWLDGGLDATSLAAAEAHASNCDRCQELLATAARTLPADAPVVSGFSRMWRWWLAPVAATAAAVTLWMVVPQEPMRPPASATPATEMAQKAQESAPSVQSAQPPPAAAAESQAKAAMPPPADARFAESRRNVPAKDDDAKAKLADATANRADAAPSRDREEKREANRERLAETAPAAPASPAAAAPGEAAALGATQLRKQVASLEFVSPDPNRRWRAVTPGTIEFSQDGGRTWIPVRLNASEVVTGGASPAPLVCWIVGRAGLVLLATDGTNFTRLPFPERIDVVSITAADAQRATVTTADGRTFRTEDNGRNWRR